MEDKPAGGDSPATAEPALSSRRRAAGQKRKVNALSVSNASSTPSKRFTREKAAISQIPIHNGGPLTRARQSPNNLGAMAVSAEAAVGGGRVYKVEDKQMEAATVAALEEEANRIEELKAGIELEFEAIRSRDANAHVVPSHCGWFSWTKIHPLEERVLPSFFNGKSDIRTPDTYMEIRNWIVKKFHVNPNEQIELKDLNELEVADMDVKQEVLEFLDYWGLINFHPFLQKDSPAPANDDDDVAPKKDSLLENLFRFESIQPCTSIVPKSNVSTPALPSGLFPESSIAEELARPDGQGVEYHCNSCSADCSRKRYHCQTQADYDLCAECFNNGKFGSDMASSDFILMEHAEAPGMSSGKWTDQETLLLLEALELFKENWNEIAEHVATKTKAQCILHFVQMPIEDVFFDCDDYIDGNSKESTYPPATTDETSAPKDETENNGDKNGAKEDQILTSPMEDANEVKDCKETVKPNNASEVIIGDETSKSKDTGEVKSASHTAENVALKALTEAFESVGYPSPSENRLSFAEAGNPVMALAAFLGKLVGRDVATASIQCSLKSLNSDSPAMQLATRHCFLLEDPPDELKGAASVDCTAVEIADQDATKENRENQTQKGNKVLVVRDSSSDVSDKMEGSASGGSNQKIKTANNADTAAVEPGKMKQSNESELEKASQTSKLKQLNDIPSKSERPSSSIKKAEGSLNAANSQLAKVSKDTDMVSDSNPSDKKEQQSAAEEPSQAAEVSKDVDVVSDSLPPENNEEPQKMNSNSADLSNHAGTPNDVNIESQQPLAPNSVVENGATTAENQKNSKKERSDCKENEDDHNIDKIKTAAVSALAAATVKAKVLANQEEDQIQQLVASLIEKQLHKLEMKLSFFSEMDHIIMRVREQLDRSRQRLYHERAQIIATRLGIPPSSSRAMPPTFPTNRVAMNLANSIPRPPMNMNSQRPPISRPMGPLAPTPSNSFVSTTTAGSSIQPSGQDKISSVMTK